MVLLYPDFQEECLVYRDNLYFDAEYIQAFIRQAKAKDGLAEQLIAKDDPSFREHALPLSCSYTQQGDIYLADLWYYPHGTS